MGRPRSHPCQEHDHPQLRRPKTRAQVEAELRGLYHEAGLRGAPVIHWPESLGRTHQRNTRRYAQVRPFEHPPVFELAPQTVYLPQRNRRALLAHEVGHVLDPHGGEDDADAAAEAFTGVRIGYDPRWPGKGLQVQRNPDERTRLLIREYEAAPTRELRDELILQLARRSELGHYHDHPDPVVRFAARDLDFDFYNMPADYYPTPAVVVNRLVRPYDDFLRDMSGREIAVETDGGSGVERTWYVAVRRNDLPYWRDRQRDLHRSLEDHGFVSLRPMVVGLRPEIKERILAEAEQISAVYPQILQRLRGAELRRNPDEDLRELERRWKASGEVGDHARYLAALMRAGVVHPAKLWLLARYPSPEREAIQLAFGEEIPLSFQIAPPGQGGLERLQCQNALLDWLTTDTRDEHDEHRFIPLERLEIRHEAWLVAMEAALRIARAQAAEGYYDGWTQVTRRIDRMRQVVQILHDQDPEDYRRRYPGHLELALDEQEDAAHYVHLRMAEVIGQGGFAEWLEVPPSWIQDAEDSEWDTGEELSEIVHGRWAQFAGYPIAYVDFDPETYSWARAVPEEAVIAERFCEYVVACVLAYLRDQPQPDPPGRTPVDRPQLGNPRVRRNGGFKLPPPCDPSKRPLPRSAKGKVRVHVNLHNGCYVVSQKGRVLGYTKTLTLKNVRPVVSLAGYQRCNRDQVRNVHAYLEGELDKRSAKRPKGKSWRRVTYNCKVSGPHFLDNRGQVFEGAEEVRFVRSKAGRGKDRIDVYVKGGPPVRSNPFCGCNLPGGLCDCGAADAYWKEPPPGCGCP